MIFDLPKEEKSIIKVIGVGGGGSNAVTHMYKQGIIGVDFIISNTDNQSMDLSPVPIKVQIGPYLTEGRGAGSKPEVGKQACEESIEEIKELLSEGTKMVFITAGMGGGTGTGAAPIIARVAKSMGLLTVAIVTVPFTFEGRRRNEQANNGLDDLKANVDSIIVISNDKLREIYGNLSLSQAFGHADNILTTAAKGIAEIITVPGYVNVDFEDVNTVMRESGVAIMGTATAEGPDRARKAVDMALNSPLLEDNDIRGAKHILLNITSGSAEVTMDEIFEITEYVQEEAGHGTDLIWGHCIREELGDKITVTVIATGFENKFKGVEMETPRAEVRRPSVNTQQPVHSPVLTPAPKTPPQVVTAPQEVMEEKVEMEMDGPHTFTFHHVVDTFQDIQDRNALNEPTVKATETAHLSEQEKKLFLEQEQQRREQLRRTNVKLNNPKSVMDLEAKPAFMRRNVTLDDVPHSSVPERSKWVLSDDDEPQIKEGNSYLHDNVD